MELAQDRTDMAGLTILMSIDLEGGAERVHIQELRIPLGQFLEAPAAAVPATDTNSLLAISDEDRGGIRKKLAPTYFDVFERMESLGAHLLPGGDITLMVGGGTRASQVVDRMRKTLKLFGLGIESTATATEKGFRLCRLR